MLLSAIYPTMHEDSAKHLMQLNLVIRDVPPQYLLSIVKSYLQNSDELSQKKRSDSLSTVTGNGPNLSRTFLEVD